MSFEPENILVIHFGQMGDVILALPALDALRRKFPRAKLTALVGQSCAAVADLAGVFDERLAVDRVELRDGNKLTSINKIRRLVGEIRGRRFDFVVDLHSLSETNLLGFLSGARARLYAHRENRSLDFFAKFPERPPREDKSKHVTDRYLDVLAPLGIADAPRFVSLAPPPDALAAVRARLDAPAAAPLVGFFPGAGHPSRRWSLENFAALGAQLRQTSAARRLIVFLGPEETGLRADIARLFPEDTQVFDDLTIPQLLAAASLLRVLVSNDTGVAHIGAVAGTNLVLVMDERAPLAYRPLTARLRVVRSATIDRIPVAEVRAAVEEFLSADA